MAGLSRRASTVAAVMGILAVLASQAPFAEGPAGANPLIKAYVTDQDSSDVSVINTVTNRVIGTIRVGTDPIGDTVTPNGRFLYVVNNGSIPGYGTVNVIRTSTDRVVNTINVQKNPDYVAVTPNGAWAYVTNYSSDTVSVINTVTNLVADTVVVGAAPVDVVIAPNG